ncbi:MAG TPA: class I SAM-dependent methyltransferase [Candidatus Thermoplasmatota archaeon]|nr:class I SAM-dependent methyltransferase [Candidatus Thermoplasmatota archaeon]
MSYRGRPGLSPVSATLLASGLLGPGDLTLDVGCGDGTEALALAVRGVPVVGVDWYGIERARAEARRRGLDATALFLRVSALGLSRAFAPATFDAALDTLVYNNIVARKGWKAAGRYVEEVAQVLRPGGLFAMAWRVAPYWAERSSAQLDRELPRAFFRFFDAGESVLTHLPTRSVDARDRGYATVGLVISRRRED